MIKFSLRFCIKFSINQTPAPYYLTRFLLTRSSLHSRSSRNLPLPPQRRRPSFALLPPGVQRRSHLSSPLSFRSPMILPLIYNPCRDFCLNVSIFFCLSYFVCLCLNLLYVKFVLDLFKRICMFKLISVTVIPSHFYVFLSMTHVIVILKERALFEEGLCYI